MSHHLQNSTAVYFQPSNIYTNVYKEHSVKISVSCYISQPEFVFTYVTGQRKENQIQKKKSPNSVVNNTSTNIT